MKTNKPMFPMFLDISEKKIFVIGGGKIATRRVKTLLTFAENISVVAPEASEEIIKLSSEGKIGYEKRPYKESDIDGADIVLAATDDAELNDDIYSSCKKLGITVNIASDKEKCDFYFPGIILKDSAVIGINAGGNDHRGAKELRQKLQRYLENDS